MNLPTPDIADLYYWCKRHLARLDSTLNEDETKIEVFYEYDPPRKGNRWAYDGGTPDDPLEIYIHHVFVDNKEGLFSIDMDKLDKKTILNLKEEIAEILEDIYDNDNNDNKPDSDPRDDYD